MKKVESPTPDSELPDNKIKNRPSTRINLKKLWPVAPILLLLVFAGVFYFITRGDNTKNDSVDSSISEEVETSSIYGDFDDKKDGLVVDFKHNYVYENGGDNAVNSIMYNIFLPEGFGFDLDKDSVQMSYSNGNKDETLAVDTIKSKNSQCEKQENNINCTIIWDVEELALNDGATLVKFKVVDQFMKEKGRVFLPIDTTFNKLAVGTIYFKSLATTTPSSATSSPQYFTREVGPVTTKLGEPGTLHGFTLVATSTHLEDAQYVAGSPYYSGTNDLDERTFLVVDFTIKNESNISASYDPSWSFSIVTTDGKIIFGKPVVTTGQTWSNVGYSIGSTATGKVAFPVEDGQDIGPKLDFRSPLWFAPQDSILVML